MSLDKAFWLIWNPVGRAPVYAHASADAARKEAERLARLHPDQRFYILQAVAYREVNNMRRVYLQSDDPDLPF